MEARMKDNLLERYEMALPGEIAAQKDGYKTIAFLKSIEGQEVKLVLTAGDAFEEKDDNIWLPNELWIKI